MKHTKPQPLSPTEYRVLSLCSEGRKYPDICERLKISLSNLHVVIGRIRKKTGIKNTKDANQCLNYLRQPPTTDEPRYNTFHNIPFVLPPGSQCTPRQLDVLQRLHNGQSYKDIARALSITVETARLHASNGRKLMGLTRQWVPTHARAMEPSQNVDDY